MDGAGEKVKPTVRSKSRTLSPSEVKILKSVDIIEQNPEVKIDPPDPDDDYEDDFESYESDFEQCSSSSASSLCASNHSTTSDSSSDPSEEVPMTSIKIITKQKATTEEKLDSGNYELRESKHGTILQGIKETNERKSISVTIANKMVEHRDVSLSDEGFDEKPPNFINFEVARKNSSKIRKLEEMKKRATDILSMIQFDTLSATMLEMLPIPYEIFMLNFGQRDTQQVYCQTNDDALSEEVQTEPIELKNKWTQHPSEYTIHKFEKVEDIIECIQNLKGSGDQPSEESKQIYDIEKYSEYSVENLKYFLNSSSEVILKLLDNTTMLPEIQSNLPFTAGYKTFNSKKVRIVDYSNSKTILTIFDDESRSVISIWSFNNLVEPDKVLVSSERVTTACFGGTEFNLIFAGLQNGGVALWDLRENVSKDRNLDDDECFRSPTYLSVPQEGLDVYVNEVIAIRFLNGEDSMSSNGQVR